MALKLALHLYFNTYIVGWLCMQGHENWVLVVAWSPDGLFLSSGDMEGKVWLWRAKTGEPLGLCRGHRKWISSIVSHVVLYVARERKGSGEFCPYSEAILQPEFVPNCKCCSM